jgi:hypothetical protein
MKKSEVITKLWERISGQDYEYGKNTPKYWDEGFPELSWNSTDLASDGITDILNHTKVATLKAILKRLEKEHPEIDS